MLIEKPSFSTPSRLNKETVNKVIYQCEDMKKKIILDAIDLKKKELSEKLGWKNLKKCASDYSLIKNFRIVSTSENIHEKFKKIYQSHLNEKISKFSKLLFYKKNEKKPEAELSGREVRKFLSNNKREFGVKLKDVSFIPKRKGNKIKSFCGNVDPEETILQDIQLIKVKQMKPNDSLNQTGVLVKDKRAKEFCEGKNSELKMKVGFKEMKKIRPINNCGLVMRKREDVRAAIKKISESQIVTVYK